MKIVSIINETESV